ncbi:MAG TPA: mechanosensitive ion channel family protein [Planctomycetota bacterium]|nr:mechanosensitive ion channel family protein [Planctomycetota bacterium]
MSLASLLGQDPEAAAAQAPPFTREELIQASLILVAGVAAAWIFAFLVRRRLERRGMPHQALVAHKTIAYLGTLLVLLLFARLLRVELTTWLATAGLLTVAVGFAAQTSLSNLIAGIFLLVDRPFQVGSAIEIDGRAGVVEEITLLSTFVRTFDNMRVRWPNEVVLKATIVNHAHYAARRVDLRVGIAYGSDVERARAVLLEAIAALPEALLDPPPEVWARAFQDSAIELETRTWVARTDFLAARSRLVAAIKDALLGAGFEIPFPQSGVWLRSQPEGAAEGPA